MATTSPPPVNDPLAGRIARFTDLEPNSALFVDTALPGYARMIWNIVGGTDAGRLTWAPDILERAERQGATLDEQGYRR